PYHGAVDARSGSAGGAAALARVEVRRREKRDRRRAVRGAAPSDLRGIAGDRRGGTVLRGEGPPVSDPGDADGPPGLSEGAAPARRLRPAPGGAPGAAP